MNASAETQAAPTFKAVAEKLATAMADTIDHPDCCEYLRMRLAEVHSGLMSEFVCDVSDDIRLRFALGAQKAAENNRPAD